MEMHYTPYIKSWLGVLYRHSNDLCMVMHELSKSVVLSRDGHFMLDAQRRHDIEASPERGAGFRGVASFGLGLRLRPWWCPKYIVLSG